MAKSIQLKFAIWMCWFFAAISSSVIVYASEKEKFGASMASIPYDDVKAMLSLTFMGGLLRTLMKVTSPDAPHYRNLTLEISKDAVGALCAGGIAYLVTSWVSQATVTVNPLLQAIIIFFSGFGGTPLVSKAYDNGFLPLIWNFFRRIAAAFAASKSPPTDN